MAWTTLELMGNLNDPSGMKNVVFSLFNQVKTDRNAVALLGPKRWVSAPNPFGGRIELLEWATEGESVLEAQSLNGLFNYNLNDKACSEQTEGPVRL